MTNNKNHETWFSYFFFLAASAVVFIGRPNNRMNPVASAGLYSSPMTKLAIFVLYKLYGLLVPARVQLPLYSLRRTVPVDEGVECAAEGAVPLAVID